ncbi:Polysaccharide deactylase family protein, PEP-CTERM locus subfamily [uncultured Desulfobacterium sp.]|uniref:Polysaccharide deactylase family protein, PEP-CTERM locus subfamily n=1 Tax=uncultured Desulfobacterium sp. TaxID=201089 RepID=A0A445MZY3_9BACT|nr:Polysaccharide deactylase family protein, PEP-CTERM locus subfamily [uncultured Desulfobacterium sp.]
MTSSTKITNFLTIDVEDYFQVHALSEVIKPDQWDNYECRVEKNTYYILDLLDSAKPTNPSNPTNSSNSSNSSNSTNSINPRATFFILGWIAERYPKLVKEIHRRGHEIASHGYGHQLISSQTPKEFQHDIQRAKKILEDLTGEEVIGYRAPTYSVTKETLWALSILAEEGYKYDSSIFPIRHDYYGIPSAPRFPFIWNLGQGNSPKIEGLDERNSGTRLNNDARILEFPMSTIIMCNHHIPCSGGGYFRIFPYLLTRMCLDRISNEGKPFVFYLHPWELDPGIPRIKNLSLLSRFRTYVSLSRAKPRLSKLLRDFDFAPLKTFLLSGAGGYHDIRSYCAKSPVWSETGSVGY